MRILYLTQYFTPEMGAPSVRVHELSRHWVEQGHEITVLTGFPNHPAGRVHPEYRARIWRLVATERIDGVRVIRTWLWPRPNRRVWERMAVAASFMASACITGTALSRFDVAIATSPQLLVGVAGWWRRLTRGTPLVFEVRDLWPESIVGVGMGNQDSLFVRTLGRVAQFLYRRSDRVVVVNEAMRAYLERERGVPARKLDVIPAGVDTATFAPVADASLLRSRWGTDARFTVSYVGTHGWAHNLEIVLDAAGMLRERAPDVLFLMVGEGAEKQRLLEMAGARDLTNVRFVPQQPLSEIPGILAASDVCLASLRPSPVFATATPTKLLEYMACARPIVSNVPGEAARLLQESGAGRTVPPGDAGALADAIMSLREDSAARAEMGRRGAEYVRKHRMWARLADQYLHLLHGVAGATRTGPLRQ